MITILFEVSAEAENSQLAALTSRNDQRVIPVSRRSGAFLLDHVMVICLALAAALLFGISSVLMRSKASVAADTQSLRLG